MSTWEIHAVCKKGNRMDFHANDVFHKKDGQVAVQILEADLIRVKYEQFCITDGKYISQGEFDTSAELFLQMLNER